MQSLTPYRKYIVASLCGLLMAFLAASLGRAEENAAQSRMAGWFFQLADPENDKWEQALSQIETEWSKSGSPALDLLLQRGRQAMEAGDLPAAIEHLTALTDQAPDFAEGWNARATAYYLSGRYGPSISDIEHVLKLEPRHFGALAGLGMMLEEIGRKAEAIKAFKASLAIHPHQEGISQALKELEQETSGTEL
ncbi:MAG: tetratricopeptide repeat protein [Rhodobacteraceae bacterium]|nr:tetratricopeptide repeat protein [Paracoccaceae bacterium]